MKRFKVVLVTALLLISFIAPAQVEIKDSDEAYNYWAKRGITELVYAYMNDYKTDKGLSEEEQKGYADYQNRFINSIAIKSIAQINSNYSDIPELLNNTNWGDTREKLFDSLDVNFKQSHNLVIEEVFQINNPKFSEGKNWKTNLDDILKGYQRCLSSLETTKNVVKDSALKDQPSQLVKGANTRRSNNNGADFMENKVSFWSQLWSFLIYVFVFIIGAFVALIYKTFMAKNRSVESEKHYNGKKERSVSSYTRDIESELKRDIKNLNARIIKLKEDSDKMLKENNGLRKELEDKFQHSNQQKVTSSKPIEVSKSLYLGMPEDDGSFYIDQATNSPEARSYFEIKYKAESSDGELVYRGGSLDVSALNQMDAILFPVCNIASSNTQSPRKIIVLKNGTVRKVNDKWVVDRKIEIELV